MSFTSELEAYIRKKGMIAPGGRVGVAVSGGADSVALLRALHELRGALGCVLAVVHFNHKIRPESDAEAKFVEELARRFALEFYGTSGDAKKFAAQERLSLETGARELRYGFFSQLPFDKIATAHTLDDQAETVLMKLLRGAGTKGISGIWPVRQHSVLSTQNPEKQIPRSARDDNQNQTQDPSTRVSRSLGMTNVEIIRPLLGVRRKEVEAYLRALGQEWCEDASNRDVKHTRNKIRHELLPLLEREYNPNIYQQLADAAEVARGDEEFWAGLLEKQVPSPPRLARDDKEQYPILSTQYSEEANADPSTRKKRSLGMTSVHAAEDMNSCASEVARAYADSNDSETRHAASLRVDLLLNEPLALRRRMVRNAFERVSGKALDFEHTDALVRFLERRESSWLQLPERWFAKLDWPRRTVSFEERVPLSKAGTSKAKSTSKPVSKKKEPLAGRKV